jgi:hypothetical protein
MRDIIKMNTIKYLLGLTILYVYGLLPATVTPLGKVVIITTILWMTLASMAANYIRFLEHNEREAFMESKAYKDLMGHIEVPVEKKTYTEDCGQKMITENNSDKKEVESWGTILEGKTYDECLSYLPEEVGAIVNDLVSQIYSAEEEGEVRDLVDAGAEYLNAFLDDGSGDTLFRALINKGVITVSVPGGIQ